MIDPKIKNARKNFSNTTSSSIKIGDMTINKITYGKPHVVKPRAASYAGVQSKEMADQRRRVATPIHTDVI